MKTNRVAFTVILFAPALFAQEHAHAPLVSEVSALGITVSDLDRSLAFYVGVLGCKPLSEVESCGEDIEHLQGVFGARVRTARLSLGEERIELSEFLAPEGLPIPADSRSNDRWFQHAAIAVRDMGKAYAHLREHRVRHASSGPQRLPDWNLGAGGIEAFYFKDPDSHVLEAIAFPEGKGDPRWKTAPGDIFLGIDHTAIVVENTQTSLGFYRDLLGLRVAGQGENWGVEQEHLNNVFGARLRITTLRAAHGPGVELLEYLAPSDGRPYPTDAHANDLVHWHTRFVAPEWKSAQDLLSSVDVPWISPGAVSLDTAAHFDFDAGLRVQDPDGHVVELVHRGQP